jgi:hypothetical protein
MLHSQPVGRLVSHPGMLPCAPLCPCSKHAIVVADKKLGNACTIHETIRVKSAAWDDNGEGGWLAGWLAGCGFVRLRAPMLWSSIGAARACAAASGCTAAAHCNLTSVLRLSPQSFSLPSCPLFGCLTCRRAGVHHPEPHQVLPAQRRPRNHPHP